MCPALDEIVRRALLLIPRGEDPNRKRTQLRMEARVQDREEARAFGGEELRQGHAHLGGTVPPSEIAQPRERERPVPIPRARGQVIEVGLRDLLGQPRAFRTEGELDHLRHHRRTAEDPAEPGAEECDRATRLHGLVDESGQSDGELAAQSPSRHPGFVEHSAPPEGHRVRPRAVGGTAAVPVEGLVSQDPADQDRVLRLGAHPRQERFRGPYDLTQHVLVPAGLLQQRPGVDRVDGLEVELLLGVHLQEGLEDRQFRPRRPQGLGRLLGDRDGLGDLLGRGGNEGHERG